MSVENFQQKVENELSKTKLNQEYSPGHGRRVEPEGGVDKHNKRIHRESKFAKEHKELPFTFRKPPKPVARSENIQCPECGHIFPGTIKTVCFICSSCNNFVKIK